MGFTGLDPFSNRVAGYMVANEDVGSTSYFGYLDTDGNWYIMQSIRIGDEVAHKYVRGKDDYDAKWIARTTQTYAAYNVTFAA